MKSIFTYKVRLVNSEDLNKPNIIQYGMGFASKYGEAAEQIEKYYRSELVSIEHICLLEPTESFVLPLPKDICDIYEKEMIPWEEWEDIVDEDEVQS